MPAELFRPAPVARRRAWLLPLSIVAHCSVLLAVFIAPIMADAELPEPAHATPIYVEVTTPPLPPAPKPPAPPQRAQAPSTAANPYAAPLTVPDKIFDRSPQPDFATVETGIPTSGGGGVPGVEIRNTDDYVPPGPEPRKPIKISAGVMAPRKIHDVAPKYPVIAQQSRIQGVVIIEAVIGADGKVLSARSLKPMPFLEDAALEAVRQWVFTPTKLNGEAVPVVMTVTVDFRLN
jgi:protein TonB